MTSFTDKNGQTWDVEFTLAELIRVKARTGLCLVNLTKADVEYGATKDEASGKLKLTGGRAEEDSAKLSDDIVLFLDVLYVMLEPKAKERGLDTEGFAGVLDSDAIFTAIEAVSTELMLFGQSRQSQPQARAAIERWSRAKNQKLATTRGSFLAKMEAAALTAETSSASPNNVPNSPASSAASTP